MTTYRFPDGFLWAAAAAACQIEGAPLEDGASPTIQHRFAQTPGLVPDGQTEAVAADHYHRYREDVALMGDIGLRGYQFSVSWARVIPEGIGAVNKPGLDFYDRLVDALLEHGVAPVPILYVWDLPGVLQDRGGWANRDCAKWFADYSTAVFDRLGDRATHWLTICEPWSIAANYLGDGSAHTGQDLWGAARAIHHMLLGHGRAVQAFRASDATGQIGTPTTAVHDLRPASDSPADVAAAVRARDHYLGICLDPVLKGEYPDGAIERYGPAWPEIHADDLSTISSPVDFVAINYYVGMAIADGAGDPLPSPKGNGLYDRAGVRNVLNWVRDPVAERLLDVHLVPEPGPAPKGNWFYNPEGIRNLLLWVKDRYGNPPVYVTENGTVVPEIDDTARIEYIRDHLIAAHGAMDEGVDLRGWFVWAIMDTWEFSQGFLEYGLIKIDFDTLERTMRKSASWYRDVIAANGFDL